VAQADGSSTVRRHGWQLHRATPAAVLTGLGALSGALGPVERRLTDVLPRFAGYAGRFADALGHARDGHARWVDGSDLDSCHTVWFELHEDLIATLGLTRDGTA
jgi:hypothetical protein